MQREKQDPPHNHSQCPGVREYAGTAVSEVEIFLPLCTDKDMVNIYNIILIAILSSLKDIILSSSKTLLIPGKGDWYQHQSLALQNPELCSILFISPFGSTVGRIT